MARTMADRLGQARARSFVGREPELQRFAQLVTASEEGAVLFVHGPAGVGKSTLVRQFAARCLDLAVACLHIDARDLPPTLEALTHRLSPVLEVESAPGETSTKTVVVIDAYELLGDLDTAFREHVAPRLPADVVLVLAGQQPASVGWRSDDGWAPILHSMRLSNLSVAECNSYLDARGVPAELRPSAIAFTHGHPLALALVGEVVKEKGTFAPEESTEVVRVLIDRLLDAMPSPTHRAALEAAAQVRVTTEPLLAALLDVPDVAELFDWMRALPFVDAGLSGLYLHDLARDVLTVDLKWRHAHRYAQYHDRARQHYLDRLDGSDPTTQAAALLDLIYLHPDLRTFLQAPDQTAAQHVEPLRPGDVDAVVGMVARHEGADSADLARRWLTARPQAWLVVRGPRGEAQGALCLLPLDSLGETPAGGDAAEADPAVTAARTQLRNHAPLRPGETATLIRFWLSGDVYQSVSPAQSLIATQFARHFLTTPGLAVTIVPFAHPEEWEAFCSYTDQRRAPAADFTVGQRTYTSFVHDWRTVPPAAWLARMSHQEVGARARTGSGRTCDDPRAGRGRVRRSRTASPARLHAPGSAAQQPAAALPAGHHSTQRG